MLRGQQIVKNREEIVRLLNQAMAAEGLAAYRYLYLSQWLSGHGAHEAGEVFSKTAAEENGHVSRLMERIIQLGGVPLASPSDWEKHSYAKYVPPPKDPAKVVEAMEQSIDAERQAIDFYNKLCEKVQHTDHVTYQLAAQLLADEVEDEHTLETFLR